MTGIRAVLTDDRYPGSADRKQLYCGNNKNISIDKNAAGTEFFRFGGISIKELEGLQSLMGSP